MKSFFSRLWQSVFKLGWTTIIIWILVVAALMTFLIIRVNKDDEPKEAAKTDSPEIAQVYEPSIGSPLPADTSGATTTETDWSKVGQVAGESTTTPSTSNNATAATQTIFVAPNTGVDPNKPIAYENSKLKFTTILPAGANVNEQGERVTFTTKQGSLLYIVSTTNAGTENLQSIEGQLRNSPSTSNLTYGNFAGQAALKFNSKDFGSGTAFLANGKIYYVFGNNQNFFTFRLM